MNFEGPFSVDRNTALAAIEEAKAKLAAWGRNDSEFGDLERLKYQVEKGEITPQGAMQKIKDMLDAKQDYN